jgi:hypothetical protein
MWVRGKVVAVFLLLAVAARADQVLTLHLDLVDSTGKPAHNVSFIAVLADSAFRPGPNGASPTDRFFLRHSRSGTREFIASQLESLLAWYPAQMKRHPETYGSPEEIDRLWAEFVKTIRDQPSSFLLAVEKDDSGHIKPLATLRFAYVDDEGKLPAEKVYGISFPTPKPRRVWFTEPVLRGHPTFQDLLTVSDRRGPPQAGVAGEKLGLHHWALDPRAAQWIFPRFIEIANSLGLFSHGRLPYPDSVKELFDGTRIPAGARAEYSRRVSDLWTEDYSQILGKIYETYGLKLVRVENSKRTGHRDVFIRRATLQQFEAAIHKAAARRLEDQQPLTPVWTYDSGLARRLGLTPLGCVGDYGDLAGPRPRQR